jgi:hypothetical protein
MIFPIGFSACFIMENDDLDDILKQLSYGNTFRCKVSKVTSGIKKICSFKARVNDNFSIDDEFYWLTNDDRRNLLRALQAFKRI